MKPLRVLQVVTYMGRAGLETMLMNYYRHIDREKVQFDFLVHRDFKADYDNEILSLGGKIYHVPILNPFSEEYWRKESEFFQIHPYKIVHSHLDCMSAYPLRNAKKAGVPIRIAHAHSKSQDKNLKYPIKLLSKRFISHYANHLFACGKEAGEWMFSGKSFEILNNAIDVSVYSYDENVRSELRKEFSIEDKFVIGHIGRFNPPKNHSFLLDVFAEYHKNHKESVLLLVGEGEGMADIKEKVKKLNLQDTVIFTGIRTDVNRILQAMDVFVFPSIYEGFPVTMVEAQAAGLPCLMSNQVPVECMITDLVEVNSLSEPLEKWVENIEKLRMLERKDRSKFVIEAGYDIKSNAERLQEFYISESKKYE